MAGNTPSASAKKSRIDQYLEMLRNAQMPDPLFFKPAKAMTKAEARDCYLYYLAWGLFTIQNRDALFTMDANGVLQPPAPEAKVDIWPPVIDNVEFQYLSYIDKKGSKKTLLQAIGNLDARNVVFLVRLAKLMKWYEATIIYHIGFVFAKSRTDCHGQGRACDFAGAAGKDWEVTVAQHWTGQPVVMPVDWTPPTGKRIAKGTRLPDWPAHFSNTTFRLDPANPYLDRSLNPDFARDIFYSVYQHAISEGTDNRGGVMSEIGATSSFVFHPDHPTSNPDPNAKGGREAHWQHMHMQVGPTEQE